MENTLSIEDKIKAVEAVIDALNEGRLRTGLCALICDLCDGDIIGYRQSDYLEGIINSKILEHYGDDSENDVINHNSYLWVKGLTPPRLEFMQEHLKNLKEDCNDNQ